ncbi:MAG: DPP IV N-terminal domain-containing protein [Bacteroidales bacterium]|nr:DPP IV N-terminal domain-containing protein [Bacteroidales bacterium]
MKKYIVMVACLLMSVGSVPSVAQGGNEIQLRDIVNGAYSAEHIYGVNPMNDGDTYSQLSPDRKRIIRRSFKNGEEVGVLFDVTTARGDVKLNGIDGYIMSPDERRILIQTETKSIYRRSFTAVYYIYDIQNNKLEPLSEGGPQQVPLFSPDGNVIAFARDNNLFLVKLLFGNAETQVTKDGKFNEVLNGIPDWVNEEEFSTNRSFDFSADSKMLAWVRYDESQVPIYHMQMFKGAYPTRTANDEYPGEYSYKYPVAGAKNSDVSVMTFDIKNRVTRTLELPMDSDGYVPRIKFTSDPEKLAVITLNRHQDRMDIYMANPRSTVCKLVVRETNDKYIREAAYTQMKFYDGHFSLLSERSGYQHLYWYNLSGQMERQVTSGNFEVTDFYGYDAATGRFYYASNEESPLRSAVYVADKKGKVKKLSTEVGTNSATFSGSMKYFMNVYSSAQQPPVTTLRDANGKLLTTLLDNANLKAAAEPVLGKKEFFTFTTSEGVTLNGWMLKPRDFDPNKKYPVVMFQYSGPSSQEVTDSWGIGFYGAGGIFESYLAQQGYVSVCVDGRGTGGRGADFEKCTYLRLGELEAKDQVETAIYLGTLPYVDKSNIAIWGWSFGGFNTLMSMTEGRPVFKAGVAVAAPSNWKYYDTVYTERYMRTPQENASGYAINPMERAANLSGSLLLIHGTADDNVHYRNAVEMSEALVQADKQFDMQVYTNRNHNIYGGNTRYHLFTRLCNFLNDNLGK